LDSIVAFYQQYRRQLATSIGVVMAMVIGLSLANGILFALEHWDDKAPVSIVAPAGTAVESPRKPASSIAKLNLFGDVQQSNVVVAAEAPETRLNLELQGVFIATVTADSTAIVAERGKDGELFSIGDRLPGNAVLEAVLNDHILLKRGGQIEKLMFSDSNIRQQFSANETASPEPAVEFNNPASRLSQIRQRIADRQRTPRTAVAQPGANLKNFVNEYRDRLESDPAGLLSELGVSAVSEGEASGYRISDELPSQKMLQAGLQEGDMILSVNGTPVGDVRSDSALIDQAMEQRRVRVEIQRDDRRFFLTVPIPEQ